MKSTFVNVRLQPAEVEMLDTIRVSKTEGEHNRSEMIRLLIHREHGRRVNGRSAVGGQAYLSDVREGRPRAPRATAPKV